MVLYRVPYMKRGMEPFLVLNRTISSKSDKVKPKTLILIIFHLSDQINAALLIPDILTLVYID